MAKLHIGKPIETLEGKAITNSDGTDFLVKDLIANIISGLTEIDGDKALILRGIGTEIVRCQDDYIDLKDHDFKMLRSILKKEFVDKKGVGNVLTKGALLDALDNVTGVDGGDSENG